MLSHYRALARYLNPWRKLLFAASVITALCFIWQLFTGMGQGVYLLPTLVSAILLLCLLVLVQLFGIEKPIPASRWRRMLISLWQSVLALLLSVMFITWFFLFLKMVSAFIRQVFF